MSENAKKAGLIAIVVIAIVAAGFGAKQMFAGEPMDVVKTIPEQPGFKSEKQQFMDNQAAGKDGGMKSDDALAGPAVPASGK
jgi:hypothetical protein